jgi:hypothetical protein
MVQAHSSRSVKCAYQSRVHECLFLTFLGSERNTLTHVTARKA